MAIPPFSGVPLPRITGSKGAGKGWIWDTGTNSMVWTDLVTQAELDALWLPATVRKSADTTRTATTVLADDPHLLFPMLAGQRYFWQAWLIFDAANATMDIKVGLSGPASATATWGPYSNVSPRGSWVGVGPGSGPGTLETISGFFQLGSAIGIVGLAIAGIAVCDATPGNLVIQWSQNTSDAGNLILKTDSILEYKRIL